MEPNFFENLPPEIVTNILSRVPAKTIARSKCVCKPWLSLFESDEFINSHLARSFQALFVLPRECLSGVYSRSGTIFEFEDGRNLESHDHHYTHPTKIEFPSKVSLKGSANGMLFLQKESEVHWICNPITREYIEVRFPNDLVRKLPQFHYEVSFYAFGRSLSGKYKVVRVTYDAIIPREEAGFIPKTDCYVYTLGNGSWKTVDMSPVYMLVRSASSVFFEGNLHWIVTDAKRRQWISCFDLETDRFTTFSTPHFEQSLEIFGGLSALGGGLCYSENNPDSHSVIWFMTEYGDDRSWRKMYVVDLFGDMKIGMFELVYSLQLFEDGDILMLEEDVRLFYYSNKAKSCREIDMFRQYSANALVFTPTFLSLKGLGENVLSF